MQVCYKPQNELQERHSKPLWSTRSIRLSLRYRPTCSLKRCCLMDSSKHLT